MEGQHNVFSSLAGEMGSRVILLVGDRHFGLGSDHGVSRALHRGPGRHEHLAERMGGQGPLEST